MDRHRSLTAWQHSHELAVAIHRAAARMPSVDRFELGSQLRRAATSVAANIAEGCARHWGAEFAHSLSIALGSLAEIDSHLALVRELGYLDLSTLDGLEQALTRTSKAVFALQHRLRGAR